MNYKACDKIEDFVERIQNRTEAPPKNKNGMSVYAMAQLQ